MKVPASINAVSGVVFGLIGFGTDLFKLIPMRIFGVATNYTMLAIPLFVFMGVLLEKSRLAERMLDVIGHLSGRKSGSMAIAIVLVGIPMGASTGIVAATVVTVGLISLPTLLRRNYDKSMAYGTICASGTLGQIIPPSLVLILLSDISGNSVGSLFAAALIPGLMLGGLYLAYIWIKARLSPQSMPPIPQAERDAVPIGALLLDLFKVVVPPIALVFAVLGSIIGGVAAPTEAASMGALRALLLVLLSGRFNLRVLGGGDLLDTLFEFLPGGI